MSMDGVSRVRWVLERVANLRVFARNVDERLALAAQAPITDEYRAKWVGRQTALRDDHLRQADELEAKLEAALTPIVDQLPSAADLENREKA